LEEVAANLEPGARPVLESLPGRTIEKRGGVESLSAEELVGLVRKRQQGTDELDEELRAVLDEYKGVLVGIMARAKASGLVPDAERPHLTTRDFVLWVLPAANDVCFTVEDRQGKVLAERIDEAMLSLDFPYLHNLLHPEYLQFYDVVDDVNDR
jgi:hypothetical protein